MWWFLGKKEVKRIEEDVKKGFESVKKDIHSVGGWIKHLDSERKLHKKELDDIKGVLSTVHLEIEELKNFVSAISEVKPTQVFKTSKQQKIKQTAVYTVQARVQTAVQTPNLDQFSLTERAILWILLNTDMKLSYDDLAAMLGKERSTIRGQVNSIKQKSEGFLEEQIERNGKKRIYVPSEVKNKILKKVKIKVSNKKKEK